MPTLRNARHERLALALAEGKTQVEAYRWAGYRGDARKLASGTIKRHPEVQDRVQEIMDERRKIMDAARETALALAKIDAQWVIEKLRSVVEQAKGPGTAGRWNLGAANRALELLGKHLGMFSGRAQEVRSPLDQLTHEQAKALLAAIESMEESNETG